MKKLFFSFFISFVTANLIGQAWPPFDCCTATLLTSNAPFTQDILAGPGKLEDIENCSCLEDGEHNTFWFKFDCTDFSNLEFIIRPEGNGSGDFDFAVWLGGCPCSSGTVTPPPVVLGCDFNVTTGPVGAGNPAQFGLPGAPNFVPGIPMLPGQTYFLVVDNKDGSNGFTIGFGAGTMIGQLPKPGPSPLSGPTEVCLGGTGSFSVPNNPLLNYVWTIDRFYFPAAGSTSNFNYTFDWPGTYEVCVEAVTGGCYESDPTCIMVEVTESELTSTESGVVCYPNPYVASNGEEFFAAGVYELEFESYQGCDSTVILTLEGVLPYLEVRSETFCQGDCVNFEGEQLCDPGIYEKIYPNQFGCDSVISLVLIEVPLEVKVLGADTLTCNKPSLVLDASTSLVGGPATFTWTNPAGDTLDTDAFLVVNAPGTYFIEVKTTVGDDVCKQVKAIPIAANTAPPAGVTATGGAISCSAASIILMGNSTTQNVSYAWTGPGGYFSNLQNPTVFVAGTYTLTVTGQNGCKTTTTAQVVEINETLTATATGGTINCYSPTVVLNGQSPNPGINYVWQGPNNTTYFGPNPTVNLSGNYLLTVTDFNGCTGTASTSVGLDTQQPQAVAAADQVLTCNTTSVFLNGNGSSFGPQFGYLWTTSNGNITDGATTLNPTVNAPGTYTLTVTNNANGCTQTAQAVAQELPDVTAGIAGQTNVLCFGENNGSAMASGGGGNGIFNYTWSNGTTGSMATGLTVGIYFVTVSDGNNCTATSSVNITQPSALNANASATAQTMQGANDGTAAVNPTGGTPDYTFLWNTGVTSATIDGLAPGTYTVSVTDANGCQSVQTVTVNEIECLLTAAISQTNIACNGGQDGTATINLNGAVEPFSFTWSNGQTTQTATGLIAGNYTVSASDANGCELVASVNISEPSNLNTNATSTDQVIPGLNDGTASANPTGGTSPYSFLWNNGETNASITGLLPGDYTVVVTDANGCQASQTVTVEEFSCGVSLQFDVTDASCNGTSNGQATALPVGGQGPFTFEWSNNETTPTIGNLPAGTYSVLVTDAGNCPVAGQVTIDEPAEALTLDITDLANATCGSDDGTATVAANGGTPGYEYLWPNGETTASVGNLAEGTYQVAVTDANGCTAVVSVEIETDNTTDLEPPVAMASDATVQLGADGTATLSVDDIDNGSFDNCGIASIVIAPTSFDCSSVGSATVTLTVTDVGGNVATATATVTVQDNIAPVFTNCPANLTLPFCQPEGVFEMTAEDNCEADLTITQTAGLPSGSIFPLGQSTVQSFTVSDAVGNSAECTFTVTVAPTLALNPAVEDVSCFNENDGSITTNVSGGSPAYTYLWSDGSTGSSLIDLGPGTFSLTVTDDAGCTSVESFAVTEPPVLVTTLVNIINETNSGKNGSVDVTVSGGTLPYTYQWFDLNNNVVGTTEDISNLAAGTYQLFVTDANGCVRSSAFTIQSLNPTNNPELEARIRIFPNPTNDRVTVELIDLPISEMGVVLHNAIGQLLASYPHEKLENGRLQVDMSHFPEGVYLMELNLKGETITKRIVRVNE